MDVHSNAALASSLRLSVMRLARRLRQERRDDDLSLNQLAVLGTLLRNGPTTVGELAISERIKPPSMTRTVVGLEAAGLVERRPHVTDGRQIVVHLTSAARRVILDDRRRRNAWLAVRLAKLEPVERDALRNAARLLEELCQT